MNASFTGVVRLDVKYAERRSNDTYASRFKSAHKVKYTLTSVQIYIRNVITAIQILFVLYAKKAIIFLFT